MSSEVVSWGVDGCGCEVGSEISEETGTMISSELVRDGGGSEVTGKIGVESKASSELDICWVMVAVGVGKKSWLV